MAPKLFAFGISCLIKGRDPGDKGRLVKCGSAKTADLRNLKKLAGFQLPVYGDKNHQEGAGDNGCNSSNPTPMTWSCLH